MGKGNNQKGNKEVKKPKKVKEKVLATSNSSTNTPIKKNKQIFNFIKLRNKFQLI